MMCVWPSVSLAGTPKLKFGIQTILKISDLMTSSSKIVYTNNKPVIHDFDLFKFCVIF